MSESTPPITTPAEAATAQLAAHPPLNRCREFEERFSALRLWRSKDGVQLWGDPVILDEGGAWVCRLGPSLMRVSGIALTEAQQEVARPCRMECHRRTPLQGPCVRADEGREAHDRLRRRGRHARDRRLHGVAHGR